LAESRQALALVRSLRQQQQQQQQQENDDDTITRPAIRFGCTIGIHPTRCQQEFLDNGSNLSPEEVLSQLRDLAVDGQSDGSVVALGEMGLDYDRLEFCPQETQLYYLKEQLQTFLSHSALNDLPLFLHNRNVGTDLLQVLQEYQQPQQDRRPPLRGVVHSFDDSLELAQQFIDLGFYIGINGCSLKTEENLHVVKELPLDKILLETDCPYCTYPPIDCFFYVG
jgi:TatD DNase family protein